MKLVIDLPSAMAGGVVVSLVGLALGAQSPQSTPTSLSTLQIPKVTEHVAKVKGIPAPEEMWSMTSPLPVINLGPQEPYLIYTVPPDKHLVVTDWHGLNPSWMQWLWRGHGGLLEERVAYFTDSPPQHGVSFPANSQVMLQNTSPNAEQLQFRFYGYLADT